MKPPFKTCWTFHPFRFADVSSTFGLRFVDVTFAVRSVSTGLYLELTMRPSTPWHEITLLAQFQQIKIVVVWTLGRSIVERPLYYIATKIALIISIFRYLLINFSIWLTAYLQLLERKYSKVTSRHSKARLITEVWKQRQHSESIYPAHSQSVRSPISGLWLVLFRMV